MSTLARVGLDEQLEAMADPRRLMILRVLMAKAARQVDVAAALGKHPAWIRHHLLRLLRVGLVELVEERKVANYTEKWYRATADAFAAHVLVTADTGVPCPVVVLGSDDLALSKLTQEDKAPGMTSVALGSLDGLIALRQGLADMAGSHLLGEDGTYNAEYVRHLFPDKAMTMVTLAHREQGLVTAVGNPLKLTTVADIARPGIRLAARNPGSGTAVWLERKLREAGADPVEVMDRASIVAKTHSDAVMAVSGGKADVTVAIRAVAEEYGLHFMPLFEERFDLIMPTDRIDEPSIAHVIDLLTKSGFKRKVGALPGYATRDTGCEQSVAL